MPEYDYVIPGIVISQTDTIVDMKELYKVIKNWFSFQGYDILEKEHLRRGPNDLFIKWENEKKMDDYVKFKFKIQVTIADKEEVVVKKHGKEKRKQRGNVKIYMETFLEKDYDDRWSKTPMQQFMRGFYDRFLIGSRMDRFAKELERQTFVLRDELKAYLKLQKA